MPQSSAIRAGRAFVELFADDSRLVRGLRQAQRKLRAFGQSVRAIGARVFAATASVTAPLAGFAINAASDAEETLSRFQQVFGEQADAVGAFADDLARSVGRSRYAVRDALASFQSFFVGLGFAPQEARGLSETMQRLAIDFASFNNLTDEDAIGRFISAMSGSSEVLDRFGVNTKQAALQQALLARGIDKSWSQVTEQEKAIARLDVIMRSMGSQGAVGDAVRTSGSFANQMKALRGQLHDTAVVIGQVLLPAVTPLVTKAATLARGFGEWAQRNRPLVATVFKVAAAAAVAGLALVVLGLGASALAGVFGLLGTAVAAVGTLIGAAGAALGALLTPIGAVVAGVVVLGSTLLWATGVGGKALDWLRGRFEALRADALAAFKGIGDALASGDIALAARVLWLALRLQWQRGIAVLSNAWTAFRGFFIDTAHRAFYGALAAFEQLGHGLQVAWIEATSFLSQTWTRFTAGFRQAWGAAVAWTEQRLHDLMGLIDDTYDADAAKAMSRQEQDRRSQQVTRDRDAALAQREDERQRQRTASRDHHQATLAVIGGEYEAARQRIEADALTRQQRTLAELDAARREWEDAIAQASAQRTAIQRGTDDGPAAPDADPNGLLAAIQARLAGVGDALSAAAASVEARGTFNAAALQSLLGTGGDLDQRIADAAEQTAANTTRLLRETRHPRNHAAFT